ncbi:hypothetical protein HDU78_000956 [Chytriomyces hyalinus]|nr:hypothetical protein HDU78_000956 [Chytriomyces hyalinus]KAJ3265664.1 hypothetical protein HDU77_004437 [Chytriomyces hyalinus]
MIRKLSRASLQALCGNEYYILLTNDTSVSIEVVGTVSLAIKARLVLDDPFVLKPGESRRIECKQGRIFAFKHYTGTPTSDWSIWLFNAYSVVESIVQIVTIVTTLGVFTDGLSSHAAGVGAHSAAEALTHLGLLDDSFANQVIHFVGAAIGDNIYNLPQASADQLLSISQAFSEVFQVALHQSHAVIPQKTIEDLLTLVGRMGDASTLKDLAEMIPGVVPGIEKMLESFRKSKANPADCVVMVEFDKKSNLHLKNGRLHVRTSEIPCHFSIKGGLTSKVVLTETMVERVRRMIMTFSFTQQDFTQEKTYSTEFFPRKSGSIFHFI